jgi:hypothetical protein
VIVGELEVPINPKIKQETATIPILAAALEMCKSLVNQETINSNPISTNKIFKRESTEP